MKKSIRRPHGRSIARGDSRWLCRFGCPEQSGVPDNLRSGRPNAVARVARHGRANLRSAAPGKPIRQSSSGPSRPRKRTLFDLSGRKMGKTLCRSDWESDDGSRWSAKSKARDDGPDANAIPCCCWRKTIRTGVFGQTKLSAAAHAGGKAPAEPCDGRSRASRLGCLRATYYFYMPSPEGRNEFRLRFSGSGPRSSELARKRRT